MISIHKYNFYYDESEHSRKINYKTITADNYSDSFVAVIVGWLSDDQIDLYEKYSAFEKKHQCRKSKGELKSTTLKQSQFANGFASLNNDNISFLKDFFDLFNSKIHVYYAIISKIEHIVNQMFVDYDNSLLVDMDAMKYSITKALIIYQPPNILDGMYKDTGELKDLLKDFFYSQIEKDEANRSLKQAEIKSFSQILILLNDISAVRKIEWNYDTAFIGFEKYLNEKSIKNYILTIDKEGENGNTAKSAMQVFLRDVNEVDSTTSCGIRIADMLAGIISKLVKALHNALHPTMVDGTMLRKTLLDKNWFVINEQQFALYKKLYTITVNLNKAWYKAFSGTYADDLIVFIAFLEFMVHFESIESLKNNIERQGEYFNAYACQSLSEYYNRMHNKLSINPVKNAAKDYVLNQRGAKVYNDTSKQPLLNIKNENTEYEVLCVGFNNNFVPMVTVKENNEIKCYRMPTGLSGWAMSIVSLANMGECLFPSKVIFSYLNGEYFANIS